MIQIAIDIGASSGRFVVGTLQNNQLQIEEIHRFSNGFKEVDGRSLWNVDHLLQEILVGLEKVKKRGFHNVTVGIDTWAVDYVLVGEDGERLQEAYCYRDRRTANTMEKIESHLALEDIYLKTGIQLQNFNTLYQLYEEDQKLLQQTKYVLLIPDYLAYRLTGVAILEMTNASTTQLLNPEIRDFDENLLKIIGLEKLQFAPFIEPGQVIGELQRDQFPTYDLPECKFVAVASHDTASAIAGTPGEKEQWAYLSSGTWSLLGVEKKEPIINLQAYQDNYTNEWGVSDTYRFLKNIMGMWILQEIIRHYPGQYTVEQVIKEATKVSPYLQYINFNEERFLNPLNMIEEIKLYCQETEQPIPHTIGELAVCVFSNLSIIYAIEMEHLKAITHERIDKLHIVGGGSKNDLLNQMTANLSGVTIYAGPSEATAIGNLLVQMIAQGKLNSIAEGRELVRASFTIQKFEPQAVDAKEIINNFTAVTTKERWRV
ncbi:rhamnulokinase [Viridibacillus arvi]|uniref:Rhamnulokinase n=1 Tax=Viridibacillus arvi TaxID=263475 RepID=A0A0M0LN83_9BACL|nr:rhamnulokinase [Viridibacillus arvi]KOO52367.1 rhamnulokinase [Viridibacillus arvi]